MEYSHTSVLLKESVEHLNIKPAGIYVDATVGGGGHSLEILRLLCSDGRLIGIDQDQRALEAATELLEPYRDQVELVYGNFRNIKNIITGLGYKEVDGILMDLGVSSYQLDQWDRGFSYKQDAGLDMRMDRQQKCTARDVVNNYSEAELKRVIAEYGEEKWAGRIAAFIVAERNKAPIETTGRLVDIIKAAIPASARRKGPHPAKRTFQAIRIEVNDELGILENAITDGVELLKPGGRICIIAFHSLEDRRVKETLRRLENRCTCPKDFPVCVCGNKPVIRLITRKPITPGSEEIKRNPRSRSALLRVAEKL